MANPVTVVPALGHGLVTSQVGPSAGFDSIDDRRFWSVGLVEGAISAGSYKVSQRAAGANMTVDVAASTGDGALVQGDSVTAQALYRIPPHTAVINVDIAAADVTNPRLDLVILEAKDDTHDVGGLNLARVRVVSGTPSAGATLDNRTGAPALPASSLHLADVLVATSDTSITDAEIRDKRTILWSGGAGGKSIIATEEARTNTAYGLLTTPDRVSGIVLLTDGLIAVAFQALWKSSIDDAGLAAIFVGANQLKIGTQLGGGTGDAVVQEATTAAKPANTYGPLTSAPGGLELDATRGYTASTGAATTLPTTGQAIAQKFDDASGGRQFVGGPCYIFAAAGTYDISVQFKASSGSVTAKERRLWVWTQAFG